jgi:hypothetical protein
MARDLVFQGVDVLSQNELKLTYMRLYLKKFSRGFAPDNHIGKGDGRENKGRGRGREGEERERKREGKGLWTVGRLRLDSWGMDAPAAEYTNPPLLTDQKSMITSLWFEMESKPVYCTFIEKHGHYSEW